MLLPRYLLSTTLLFQPLTLLQNYNNNNNIASTRKTEKYSTLSSAHRFEPTAVENLGTFSSTTLNCISELGRRICVHTGDARETSYLFQRISIMLQCFNSMVLLTCRTSEHPKF